MSEKKVRSTRTSPVRHPGSKWWMLAKDDDLGEEVLLANCDSEHALPVFSGESEAEMFVWLGGALEEGWQVRQTSSGELVSILYGPCAGVGRVALDPSPEMVAETIRLVSVSRETFVNWIVDSVCPVSLGVSTRHHARRLVRPLRA